MDLADHLTYGALWLSFGALHSMLARERVRAWLAPLFGAGYRLAYNAFALVHFAAIWAAGRIWLEQGALEIVSHPALGYAMTALLWSGIAVICIALLEYDKSRFLGLAQLQAHRANLAIDEDGPLIVSGSHRYCRHPLYLGLLMFFWGGAVDEYALATAIWVSAYLVVGTWFEERSLVARYGEAYIGYQRRVPIILPWRGRVAAS